MSAPASLPALLAEIERRGTVPKRLVPVLLEQLREVQRWNERRVKPLQRARKAQADAIRRAIHRAADAGLPEHIRQMYPRRVWAGKLRNWLTTRYQRFGLSQRPCMRTVRRALNDWKPTFVSTSSSPYAETSITTESDKA